MQAVRAIFSQTAVVPSRLCRSSLPAGTRHRRPGRGLENDLASCQGYTCYSAGGCTYHGVVPCGPTAASRVIGGGEPVFKPDGRRRRSRDPLGTGVDAIPAWDGALPVC
jgi:hypothetical protein